AEFFFGDLTLTFLNGHDAIYSHAGNFIDNATRPTHLNEINFGALLETEVQPQVTLREVAVTAANFVDLGQVARDHLYFCADAAPIAFHPNGLDQDRIVRVPTVVAQQLRRSVQIDDYQIYIAVVIDVPEGDAAAGSKVRQHCAKLAGYFTKGTVAIVSKQQLRLKIIGKLRVNMTISDKQVHPTVIVVVKEFGSPTNVGQAHGRNFRCE